MNCKNNVRTMMKPINKLEILKNIDRKKTQKANTIFNNNNKWKHSLELLMKLFLSSASLYP